MLAAGWALAAAETDGGGAVLGARGGGRSAQRMGMGEVWARCVCSWVPDAPSSSRHAPRPTQIAHLQRELAAAKAGGRLDDRGEASARPAAGVGWPVALFGLAFGLPSSWVGQAAAGDRSRLVRLPS